MPRVLNLRSLLVLLASLRHWKGPLKRLLLLWRYLKQLSWSRLVGEDGGKKGERPIAGCGDSTEEASDLKGSRTSTPPKFEYAHDSSTSSIQNIRSTNAPGAGVESKLRKPNVPGKELEDMPNRVRGGDSQDIGHVEVTTICASRRPLSALELHLDHPHGQFLQPGDTPARPVSMVLPGQSPVHGPSDMLHPYSYTHSNGSKASNISISVVSTDEPGPSRGRHLGVARGRPEAGHTPRAAARGISRIASRPPSRPTSRSRSRAHSQTPLRSLIDLPLPGPGTAPSTGTRPSVALPSGEVAEHTPETIPPISLPHVSHEDIWPILVIPRYDKYVTVSPRRTEWRLPAVTTDYKL